MAIGLGHILVGIMMMGILARNSAKPALRYIGTPMWNTIVAKHRYRQWWRQTSAETNVIEDVPSREIVIGEPGYPPKP